MALCVCLSVCPSQAGCLDRCGFWHRGCRPLILHCVVREFGHLQNNGTSKIMVTFSQTLFKLCTSQLHVDRRKCCQLGSTDDRRQFITLSVHLCLQHLTSLSCDGREAGRRTGLSASAETCYKLLSQISLSSSSSS